MKTVEQRSPVQYSPRRQSMWMLADYGGKDLWNRWVLSLEWNGECVMEGESGEQVGGELESVTSSAGSTLVIRFNICLVISV